MNFKNIKNIFAWYSQNQMLNKNYLFYGNCTNPWCEKVEFGHRLVVREFPAIVFSTGLPVYCLINQVNLEGIFQD